MGQYTVDEHLEAQQQGLADEDRPRRWKKLGIKPQEVRVADPDGDDDDDDDPGAHSQVTSE